MSHLAFFVAGLFLGIILRTAQKPKHRARVPMSKDKRLQRELDEIAAL